MAVYAAARDLNGVFIGTHQFLIIEPTGAADYGFLPKDILRDLGNGTKGIVVGAHNRRHLKAIFFEEADYQATKEYYNPGKYVHWYSSDYDTEVHKVDPGAQSESSLAKRVLYLVNNFMLNETHLQHKYPTGGFGINSNSWAQTVIELAGGTVQEDFSGVDVSHRLRVPALYFGHAHGSA